MQISRIAILRYDGNSDGRPKGKIFERCKIKQHILVASRMQLLARSTSDHCKRSCSIMSLGTGKVEVTWSGVF